MPGQNCRPRLQAAIASKRILCQEEIGFQSNPSLSTMLESCHNPLVQRILKSRSHVSTRLGGRRC